MHQIRAKSTSLFNQLSLIEEKYLHRQKEDFFDLGKQVLRLQAQLKQIEIKMNQGLPQLAIHLIQQHVDAKIDSLGKLIQSFQSKLQAIQLSFSEVVHLHIEKLADFHQDMNRLIKADLAQLGNLSIVYNFDDTNSQRCRKHLAHSGYSITKLISTPDYVISASVDQKVKVWTHGLELVAELKDHTSWVRCLVKLQQHLITSGDDSKIIIYEEKPAKHFQKLAEIGDILSSAKSYVRQLLFMNDLIICSKSKSADYDIFVYQYTNPQLIQRIHYHHNICLALIRLNYYQFISADANGQICIWRSYSRQFRPLKSTRLWGLTALNYNEQHELFFCGMMTGRIYLMTLNYRVVRTINLKRQRVKQIDFLQNGLITFSSHPNAFVIFNIWTYETILSLRPQEVWEICTYTINEPKGYIALGDQAGFIFFYDFQKSLLI